MIHPFTSGPSRSFGGLLCLVVLCSCAEGGTRKLGATCARDDECASNRCDELVCKSGAPLGPGERCTSPYECASENCSVIDEQARCGPGTRAVDAPCSDDLQCASAHCVEGACAEGSSDGGLGEPANDTLVEGPSGDGGPVDAGGDGSAADASSDLSATTTYEHAWNRALGGVGREEVNGVAVDGSGNVYVTGFFDATADLGNGDVATLGGSDIFLTSFDVDGLYRWHKNLGGASGDSASSVAVDRDGNVYIVGSFGGTAELGGGSVDSLGGSDAFVSSFAPDGAHRWQRRLGGTSSESAHGVAVDGSGDVYLIGEFSGTADFGGGSVSSAGSSDIFVTRFSSAGVHRWQKALGGSGGDEGRGVAVDTSGNIYLTGFFSDTADLGDGAVTAVKWTDVFLTSFAPGGNHRWKKAMGGEGDDYGRGVAVDRDGNVTITGDFFGAVDFGGGSVNSLGDYDGFATSFTSAGVHRWQKSFGSAFRDYGYGVATDDSGNVFLTGYFEGTADLGGGSVSSSGGNNIADIYITSFTAAGVHRWQKALGGTGHDAGHSVSVDASGSMHIGGYLSSGTADLGEGMISYSGRSAFVVRFQP